MLKRILMCGAMALLAASVGLAQYQSGQSKPKSSSKARTAWAGWITDSECGAKGANDKHADCAKKCVETKGAKYVLYDPASKKTYNLDNQTEAAEHSAHHVNVEGSIDGDTIHVTSISMVPAKKSAAGEKSKS